MTSPSPGWVRVQGTVVRLRGAGVGGWEISYPLPDGSPATFSAAFTQPSVLREGMTVDVLVDAGNPRNARLDHAPYARVRNRAVGLVVGVFALVALFGLGIAALLVFLSRL